ncbi:DNA repair protein RecO [Stenotrophomonas rhizophila]
MRIEDEPAFVLHARAWRETSLLVEVLTEQYGRIGVLARGVSSPRSQALRAALQPLQWIRLTAVQRGELAQLRGAEALDAAPRLTGEAMLAGFYINELMMRLAPRQDPLPELYDHYAQVRARLRDGEPLAWTLRRFERDLLEALGFGFDLLHGSDESRSTRRRAMSWIRRRGHAGCSATAAWINAGARPPAARCWRWPPMKCPVPRIWAACAGRSARC